VTNLENPKCTGSRKGLYDVRVTQQNSGSSSTDFAAYRATLQTRKVLPYNHRRVHGKKVPACAIKPIIEEVQLRDS
jgi:hypothetical protein